MNLATYIDDISLRIYAGRLSDDRAVEREQIGWWLKTTRDLLVKTQIDEALKSGKPVDPFYVTREICKVSEEEETECADDCDLRWKFALGSTPLSIWNDLGVVRVETTEGLTVLRTRIESVALLNDLKWSKPGKYNLTWYRDGNNIIISGLRDEAEFNVYYIASSENIAESDEFKVSNDLAPVLLETVEQIARRELTGIPDLQNDGEDVVSK